MLFVVFITLTNVPRQFCVIYSTTPELLIIHDIFVCVSILIKQNEFYND